MSRTRFPLPVFPALCAALAFAAVPALATEPPLVPRPAQVTPEPGEWPIPATLRVQFVPDDPDATAAAHWLQTLTRQLCGRELRLTPTAQGDIRLHRRTAETAETAETGDAAEAYRLNVIAGPVGGGLHLEASHRAGLLHAAGSAAQLLCWPGREALPAMRIADAPQFRWRGAMLDSARHMPSVDYIKRFLDAMALHKLNVLHWHLTDDQAWRIQITRYPRLTEVGAWRVPAGAGERDIDPATGQPRRYGGFYTQDQVRDVVAYAAARGIEVVPEIEMPGHASAAIAAYPELAALAGSVDRVPADWGIYDNAFTLEEHGFEFLQNVLDEVIELFPSPWLHVGGDEVAPVQWQASERGKALLAQLPGDDPMRVQTWFTQRIARYLDSRGKRLIGWDEILAPGLPPRAVVMSWRGIEGAIEAARQGHDTILSPWPTLYLDNQQRDAVDEPPGRLRVIALREVYGFDPLPAAIAPEQRHHVLGMQANLWAEHIRTEARVSHMGFPRLAAVAEVAWTPAARRDYAGFLHRLAGFWPHYAAAGIAAADSAFAVQATLDTGDEGRLRVSLASQEPPGAIHYTLDGSTPDAASPRYATPLELPAGGRLRAVQVVDGRAIGAVRETALDPAALRQRHSRELARCSEGIDLALEDDYPPQGERAVFAFNIQHPCWVWKQADLRTPARLLAYVGQVPFNFQIGAARDAIVFPKPRYQGGELLVFEATCEGEPLARLPLGSAHHHDGVIRLAPARLPQRGAPVDLCFRFAQSRLEPLWAIDRLELVSP